MNLNKKLIPLALIHHCLLLIVISSSNVFAQEQVDSLLFAQPHTTHLMSIRYLNEAFQKEFPLSGKEYANVEQIRQFYSEKDDGYATSRFYAFQSSSVYEFRKGGYRYEMLNDPLQLHMHFSMKEQFDWEKWDIYLDGSTVFTALYAIDEATKTFVPLNRNDFFWEVGVGVGYEFNPNKEVFMEFKGAGAGTNLINKGYKGGVRMKF